MPSVIDGNNVIGTWPGLRVGDRRAEAELRHRLRAFTRRKGKAVLVFDGEPPEDLPQRDSALGPLRIVYAGSGRDAADRWILRFVEGLSRPREWSVVTDDRALGQACRSRGARWIRNRALREMLEEIAGAGPGEGQDGPLDGSEVKDWQRWFERGGEEGD